jgi:hypothetical protein
LFAIDKYAQVGLVVRRKERRATACYRDLHPSSATEEAGSWTASMADRLLRRTVQGDIVRIGAGRSAAAARNIRPLEAMT